MRSSLILPSGIVSPVLLVGGVLARRSRGRQSGSRGGAEAAAPPLLQDYIAFTVTAPPAALELDPFYKKYVDALGIPVVTSAKVPDAALLMARDIVQFMLANRPDLRKELIRKKWKLAIMARDRGHLRHPRAPQVPAAAEDRRRAADAAAAGELQQAGRRRHA